MRRILLLITDLQIGGTPAVVRELAVRLAAEPDVKVHVACLDHWGPVADQLRQRGVAVTALNARCPADVSVVLRLIQFIHREKFDTVLSFLVHANAVAAVGRLALPGIRFLQSIQTAQPRPRWHWAVQRLAQHAAEKIIVPSPSVAEVARQWADVAREKICIIPNAVDPAEFSVLLLSPSPCTQGEDRGEGEFESAAPLDAQNDPHPNPLPEYRAREQEKSRGSEGRIGFIGRLDPVKRIGDLIEAMPLLEREITLHIYGQGRQRGKIKSAIARLNLQQRVMLHGPIAGSVEALKTLDALVLPSEAEGFGLVLIEAMAAGVPVIGTNVPGIRDVIADGVDGLLVPPRNPPALAAAIGKILRDAPLRQRLIAGGIAAVRQRFTWQQVYAQYRTILQIKGKNC